MNITVTLKDEDSLRELLQGERVARFGLTENGDGTYTLWGATLDDPVNEAWSRVLFPMHPEAPPEPEPTAEVAEHTGRISAWVDELGPRK